MAQNDDAPVLLDKRSDRVAIVTINRPQSRNSVNTEVAIDLEGIVQETERDPEVCAIVLQGAGSEAFSAGADLKEVAAGNLSYLFTDRGGFAGFVHAQRSKPWIAAVDGLALAGGCEIALACDLIVASESAEFGLPEVTRGLVASAGGLYRLTRSLPRAIAIELILTADRLPAARALDLGLINRLARTGCATDVAHELALKISANAPLAVRESLAIAKLSYDLSEEELRTLSENAQMRMMSTKDFVEGPKAFIEKRSPRWVGA
tara:strand:+ start:2985 stop:3773 length:789 start_codon:yes stop_codon:yes gene_type:complete